MILESLRMASRALRANKLRSFLTMLGVIIGVFSIVELLAVGQGVKAGVTKEVEAFGTNLVIVFPGALQKGRFNPASTVGVSTLTDRDVEAAQALPAVRAVAPLTLASGSLTFGQQELVGPFIFGTTSSNASVRNLSMLAGSFFSEQDESASARIMVLGEAAARRFTDDPTSLIDQTIRFRQVDFAVRGIVKNADVSGGLFGGAFDDAVYVPLSTLRDISGSNQIFRILVSVRQAEDVKSARATLEAALKVNHGGEIDFSVLTQDDLLDIFENILSILTIMISAIASISLVVGGIGIMNIMLVAVAERTKEIGIRKALGASNRDIVSQFLIEAFLLSLVGALAGVLLAAVVAAVITSRTNFAPILSLPAGLLGVGFSALVGVLFGTAPAVRASRLNPIDALRYE